MGLTKRYIYSTLCLVLGSIFCCVFCSRYELQRGTSVASSQPDESEERQVDTADLGDSQPLPVKVGLNWNHLVSCHYFIGCTF